MNNKKPKERFLSRVSRCFTFAASVNYACGVRGVLSKKVEKKLKAQTPQTKESKVVR